MAHPTGPGHEVDHSFAPALDSWCLPPYGSGYSSAPAYGVGTGWYLTSPPYGSGYSSAPAYGGGTGWYPTGPAYGGYHAPGYVPYIYPSPAAEPVQQHQNRPVIPGIVTAGIEALAVGVFKAAISNNLFGDGPDGSGFNF